MDVDDDNVDSAHSVSLFKILLYIIDLYFNYKNINCSPPASPTLSINVAFILHNLLFSFKFLYIS